MGRDGFVAAMTERWQSGDLRLRDFQSSADDALLKPGVDDARVGDILGGAYDNIATKGNISIEPGVTTQDTMADRYNRRRVFEWTSDTAYFDFADTFGNGADNLGEAFSRHLHQMSLDLGTARILGGDPDKMANTLIQYGQKSGISQGQTHALEKLYYHSSAARPMRRPTSPGPTPARPCARGCRASSWAAPCCRRPPTSPSCARRRRSTASAPPG